MLYLENPNNNIICFSVFVKEEMAGMARPTFRPGYTCWSMVRGAEPTGGRVSRIPRVDALCGRGVRVGPFGQAVPGLRPVARTPAGRRG